MADNDLWRVFYESLMTAYTQAAEYLPNLLGALVLLLGGWFIARLMRGLTARFFDSSLPLLQKISRGSVEPAGVVQRRIRALCVNLVFWVVLLIFVAAALQVLDIDALSIWISDAVTYLPNLIAGVLIVFVGFLLGGMAQQVISQTADSLDIRQAPLLGRIAQAITILFGVVIGLGQVGIDVSFLSNVITVLLLASLGGLALTVALSSRQQVGNYLAANYVRKLYRVDDRVRIDDHEGRIVEIGDWCVLLETHEGDLAVPASRFLQSLCLKLSDEAGREKP